MLSRGYVPNVRGASPVGRGEGGSLYGNGRIAGGLDRCCRSRWRSARGRG